jgi:hypothetical protein
MGGGNYSGDVAERQRSTGRQHFTYQGHGPSEQSARDSRPTRKRVHEDLDPKNSVRECRDSEDHPTTTPIGVIMDVTRSRGDDAKVIYGKLPMFIGQIIMRNYVLHPVVSFAAVGDATSGDFAPLQVGQFESDNRLDEVLGKIWLEEGGGGTGQESYELAAYYYARKVILDANERGEKGYLFFLGDEGFYPKVARDQIKVLIGDDLPNDLTTAEIFRELQQKWHVFFIYPRKPWEDRIDDIEAEMKKRVIDAGGQYENVDFRASLLWNNRNDLDLHVIDPNGFHISFRDKRAPSGGWLDVDMNVGGESTKPVENIRWKKGEGLKGTYKVFVRNYAFHEGTISDTPFQVEIEINGQVQHFEGVCPANSTGPRSDQLIGEFEFDPSKRQDADEAKKAYADEVILAQWESVLPPENILQVDDPRGIVDVMLGALALVGGGNDLDTYMEHMVDKGQTDERQDMTREALAGLVNARSGGVDVSSLPSKPSSEGGRRAGRPQRIL